MMETKKFIKEKLHEEFNPHKRMSMVKAIMNKCANNLFDVYRELDMAIQYCDDPSVRERLEAIRRLIGKDDEISWYMDAKTPTVISDLQKLADDIKP